MNRAMVLPVTFHFPSGKTWAVGRHQGPVEQQRQEHSEPPPGSAPSPYQHMASISHHPLCASISPSAKQDGKSTCSQSLESSQGLCLIPYSTWCLVKCIPSESLPCSCCRPTRAWWQQPEVVYGDQPTAVVPCFLFQMATVSRLLEAAEHVQAALLLGRLPGGLPAMVTTPSISVYTNR